MRQEALQQIIDKLQSLAAKAKALKSDFRKLTKSGEPIFDISKEVPGRDLNYADCLTRLLTVADLAKSMADSKRAIMTPKLRYQDLDAAINEVDARLQDIKTKFETFINNNGGIQSFSYENFHILANNSQAHDFSSLFKNLVDGTEKLLEHFYTVSTIVLPNINKIKFGAISEILSNILEEQENKLTKINKIKDNANTNYIKLKEILRNFDSAKINIESLLSKSIEINNEIDDNLESSATKRNQINEIYENASSLEKEVSAYRNQFREFDKALDERMVNLKDGLEQQKALFKVFESNKVQVAELISKSESMLTGATAAGLASSFGDARNDLDRQLDRARWVFYFGIGILFVSAVPLLLHVALPVALPILQQIWPNLTNLVYDPKPLGEPTSWQYLGQVFGRYVILLPAIWFVSFASRRHASLFRLREHYSYKYSMAVSIEGFSKQAEDYRGEIAAMVLEQIAFNPADKMPYAGNKESGARKTPIWDKIVSRFPKPPTDPQDQN